MTSHILKHILETLDHLDILYRTSGVTPVVLLNSYGSRLGLPLLQYINNPGQLRATIIRAPYGTSLCRFDIARSQRLQQQVANLLVAPPSNQQHTASRYSISATILANPPRHAVNSVIHPETRASLKYCHLRCGATADMWSTSFDNELGHLTNGVGTQMPGGFNTIGFIPTLKVPSRKMPTYVRLVCDICPHRV